MSDAQEGERLGLTVPEACHVIGIGRSLAYELIREGKLPARKLGKRTIVLREDALALLRSLPRVAPPQNEAGAP